MVCPKCGKNTSDYKDFCEHCGAALIGLQSIYLNEPNPNHKIDKNNISSITGIDINKISQSTSAFNDFNVSMADTSDSRKKADVKIKVDFKLILLFILMLIIFGLSIYIMKRPSNKLASSNNDKCENKVVTEEKYIGIKVSTAYYNFTTPDGYEYSENVNTDEVVIRGGDAEIIVYPVASGRLDNITSNFIESKYSDYTDVKVEETVYNQRKIYFINYLIDSTYYIDFYYQFSGEKIVYGQAQASDKETINSKEVRDIITSLTIRQSYNDFKYNPSGFDYEKVLSSLK